MIGRWLAFHRHETGNVAIPFAASLILLVGLAALVIDLGRAYVVKREIQKAAEAGAMAGARALAYNSGDPDFANGKTVATTTVRSNYANGALLSDFNTDNSLSKVQSGYWDTSWTMASAPANLNGYTDPVHYTPSATEKPAVKVTIAKTAGGTGSSAPVSTYFASILGVGSQTMQTQAVAILYRTGPATAPPGACFPLATPVYWVNQYWDSDPPVSFRIGSANLTDDGGDWTSFVVQSNSTNTIDDLVDNGNPTAISIGDQIWVTPGVRDSIYKYAADSIGHTFLLAVVPQNYDANSWATVKGFAAFHITGADNGSDPYIEGHFVKDYVVPNTTPGGPYYGASAPMPKLVQ